MQDEQTIENGESTPESTAETSQAQVTEAADYMDHLILIEQGQQVQAGLMCVIIGLILVSIIFNVIKRFF